ncbi:MAG: hypothetical protein OXU86_08205 [Thaumarchaeota archaeon]|nr:hypothetical protein [Nitrososphaerota archaeon]
MTAEPRQGGKASGKNEADRPAPQQPPTGHAGWEAGVAEGRREARRQRAVFESRREEILAAHPGKDIAVCAGEVFAADTPEEAAQMAWRAHGGRASYFYTRGYRLLNADPGKGDSASNESAGHAGWEASVAEGRREARRQRAVFESRREEILAAHPGKDIAVCAGEVFAADTPEEAAQMAWRAHGGRASYFYTRGYRILDTLA